MSNNLNAVLLLSDGTAFHGKSCGKIGTATGEIAFNTGMTGYQEIFTDPSYYGQIITMANAHIGNYGTNKFDIESKNSQIKGLVVKKFARYNFSFKLYIVNFHKVGSVKMWIFYLTKRKYTTGLSHCFNL